VKCPIKKGTFGPIKVKESLPKTVPKGKYKGLIKMTDQKKEGIICVNFEMAVTVSLSDMVLDDAMIANVNGQNSGWTAGRNDRFEGVTIGEVINMLLPVPNAPRVGETPADENLPEEFDAKKQWPKCIHDVRDQGHCGSCWAFALSESLTDRFCIASHGSVNEILSPQYLVSCDKTDLACQGGYLDRSWAFASNTGISTEKCFPYESGSGYVPACIAKCKDTGSPIKFYRAKNAKGTPSVEQIQNQMYTYGPLEGAFQVYQDFMTYKNGVYKHISGSLLGGHAIKCMGWGVEKGTPYWFCQNSWTTSWGDKGYFKILRGKDECGIESWSWAGEAAL